MGFSVLTVGTILIATGIGEMVRVLVFVSRETLFLWRLWQRSYRTDIFLIVKSGG